MGGLRLTLTDWLTDWSPKQTQSTMRRRTQSMQLPTETSNIRLNHIHAQQPCAASKTTLGNQIQQNSFPVQLVWENFIWKFLRGAKKTMQFHLIIQNTVFVRRTIQSTQANVWNVFSTSPCWPGGNISGSGRQKEWGKLEKRQTKRTEESLSIKGGNQEPRIK